MIDPLHQHSPNIDSKSGKTAACAFFLFTYLGFNWKDDADSEAVVVGVDFVPSQTRGEVVLRGDICGDETGHVYYEIEKKVPETRLAILTAARETAEQLSKQVDVVEKALSERRSSPSYRGRSE
jgi:hypothetical protein